MELVATYLYSRIQMETSNISNMTFHNLKRHGWYNDTRTNRRFTMLNKRIKVDNQWYRALVRFEGPLPVRSKHEVFELSFPCPFIITECEPIGHPSDDRWKDIKIHHGPKLGSVMGFLENGIPSEIIEKVYQDLMEHVIYN